MRRTVSVIMVLAGLALIAAAAYLVLRPSAPPAPSPQLRAPEAATAPFEAGVQSGLLDRDATISSRLGAPVVRIEWAIGTPARELRPVVAEYARLGIRVQPLASFAGRLPTAQEARNVGAWARAVGPESPLGRELGRRLAVRDIEFGNETSFAYHGTQRRGGEYARLAVVASRTAAAHGVGLMIQADEANQVDGWIDQMYDAVDDLHRYASAWIVHPYGPQWRRRLDQTITRTAARGAPRLPIAITELGIANDDGRCLNDNYRWPRCLTSEQAAAILRGVIGALRRDYPRVTQLILYTNHDLRPPATDGEREHYFGARRWDGSSKGAYTRAAEALMASGTP